MPIDDAPMFTVATAATRLSVAIPAVLSLIASGKLMAINVSLGSKRPRWRIERAELERFLAARQSGDDVRPVRRRRSPGRIVEYV